MPKVRFSNSIVGGDELVVEGGGRIKIFGAGAGAAGGGIVGSGGTKAAHIANRSPTTVTAGAVLATKFNPQFAALASGMNSILTALRSVGLLATG